MSIINHPCDRHSCPECVRGQCFGGGCRYNLAQYAVPNDERDAQEDWFGEDDEENE